MGGMGGMDDMDDMDDMDGMDWMDWMDWMDAMDFHSVHPVHIVHTVHSSPVHSVLFDSPRRKSAYYVRNVPAWAGLGRPGKQCNSRFEKSRNC